MSCRKTDYTQPLTTSPQEYAMTTATRPEHKTRIITLTTAAPVRIREADWLIISQASAVEHEHTAKEATTWLKVRRHSDGRAIVYGGRDTVAIAPYGRPGPDLRAGELLQSGDDIAAALWRLARELDAPDLLTREAIAKLPAVEI